MQPLYAAIERSRSGGGDGVGEADVLSLEFFERLLAAGLPGRVYDFSREEAVRPVLIWSDAMYETGSGCAAGIGFVVFVPRGARGGRWYYSASTVGAEFMRRFMKRKQYIGQLEQLAAVAVYYTLALHPELREVLRDAPVLHFIDNYAAAQSLCKGYASAIDSARIVHAMWSLVGVVGCCPWFSYIRTKGNVADIPSRLEQDRGGAEEAAFRAEMEFVRRGLPRSGGARSVELDCRVPAVAEWTSIAASLGCVVPVGSEARGLCGDGGSRKRRRRHG